MNPATTTSHTSAVASAATKYPQVPLSSQQTSATDSSSQLEPYGLVSHVPSHPQPSLVSVQSSAYTHLVQYQNSLQDQHSSTLHTAQGDIDYMWKQKVNSNPWVLTHYNEMRLERDQVLSQERKRTHERIEDNKEVTLENERQMEWRGNKEQDQHDREQREQAQREAVHQHFEESLRLALQKQKNMGWNPQSGSKSNVKPLANLHSQSISSIKTSEDNRLCDHEKERSHFIDSSFGLREHEKWLAAVQQQRNNQPHHRQSIGIPEGSFRTTSTAPDIPQLMEESNIKTSASSSPVSSSVSQMKHETNFSLYGYQPFQHTYITHAQLKAREETKSTSYQPMRNPQSSVLKNSTPVKIESDCFMARTPSPTSNIATNNGSSKQQLRLPHPAQEMSGIAFSPLVGSGGAFKPYEYSSNSSSPAPPAHQNPGTGRVSTSAQQSQDQPQNLVKSDGGGCFERIPLKYKYSSKEVKLQPATSNSLAGNFSHLFVTSKPTSSTTNTQYSYSLIHQGLVPNPLYIAPSHGSSGSNAPYVLPQTSKVSTRSDSLPAVSQYLRVSPNSTNTAGSPASKSGSASYTTSTNCITHNYSPVEIDSNSILKLVSNPDTSLSSKSYNVAPRSSQRSPSPSIQNSLIQSSQKLTISNHSPINLLGHDTSSFDFDIQLKKSEPSAIPLVKRKLISDISKKKSKSFVGNSHHPKPHSPAHQSTEPIDSLITYPHMSHDLSSIEQNVDVDSFHSEISLSLPNVSCSNIPKSDSSVSLPVKPALQCSLSNSSDNNSKNSFPSNFENLSSLSKFSIIGKKYSKINHLEDISDVKNDCSFEKSSELEINYENFSKCLQTNSSLVGSAIPNSFHPKLKKAWLQRHSENEDKKSANDVDSDIKLVSKDQISLQIEKNAEPVLIIQNTNCLKLSIAKNKNPAGKELIETEILSSSSSGTEYETKPEKRKIKSNRKYLLDCNFGNKKKRIKTTKDMDSFQSEILSPDKEKDQKRKKTSCNDKDLRKKGKKNKEQLLILDEKVKRKGFYKSTLFTARPTSKTSVIHLRKTGEPFLQDGSCCEIAPRLPKCRECRMTPHQRNKKMPNIFCRFYAYRKLRYGKNGTILSAGFSEPSDASEEDLKLWLPPHDIPIVDTEIEISKFLLTHIGDQFCDLVEMEKEAQKLHINNDGAVTWKRVVQGIREMCDVCEMTLFNIHWVCHKCGFVVCIDCYKLRKTGLSKGESSSKDRDEYHWLFCSNRLFHEQDKLMLTQIIAGTALWDVGKSLHEIRRKWNIPTYCNCGVNDYDQDSKNSSNGICKLMSAVTKCFSSDKDSLREGNNSSDVQKSSKKSKSTIDGVKQEDNVCGYSSESGSPLSWLADVALNSSKMLDDLKDEEKISNNESNKESLSESDEDKNENFSTLRELLIRPTGKMGCKANSGSTNSQKTLTSTLDEVISCVVEQKVRKSDKKCKERQLLYFIRRFHMQKSRRELPPVRTCFLSETSLLYPEIPHLWFGSGKILLLKNPYDNGNIQMFQEQWKRGQPVIVADVGKKLDSSLWSPESFLKEYGDQKADFLNCLFGTLIQKQPMKKFWEGFENLTKRMKNDEGEALVLKLSDWPPAEEFSDVLPSRYEDLMKVLPLRQYTHPEGVFNLASRLPQCFVQPDLGPRMYNAYGISSSLGKGSSNLHLDTSDSVNLLAYVAIPRDGKEELSAEILKTFDECGCDALMKRRAKSKNFKPGAIWHIYNATDADKIRDFCNKVSEEQGVKKNPYHDPLYNQEWYLDDKLRIRLQKEYGVESYTIVQCLGDALFIPAGSPHQVLNIHSCIKVSEDFISPESIGYSLFLTQDIRNLSDKAVNCEDRLQIKNIIYHAVKDALALLQSHDPKDTKV